MPAASSEPLCYQAHDVSTPRSRPAPELSKRHAMTVAASAQLQRVPSLRPLRDARRDPRTRRTPYSSTEQRRPGAAGARLPAQAPAASRQQQATSTSASVPIIDTRPPPPFRRRDADGRFGEVPAAVPPQVCLHACDNFMHGDDVLTNNRTWKQKLLMWAKVVFRFLEGCTESSGAHCSSPGPLDEAGLLCSSR